MKPSGDRLSPHGEEAAVAEFASRSGVEWLALLNEREMISRVTCLRTIRIQTPPCILS